MKTLSLFLLLLLPLVAVQAKGPVYVILWFDTEDPLEPAADDAAQRIARELTSLGIPATFKITGDKLRVLEKRNRGDVLRDLARHEIGYHSNYHSVQPVPSIYLQHLGMAEGAAEWERRELSGIQDLRRVFNVNPICYGQPGSSWGPQVHVAMRKLNIPVYLDEGNNVGLNGRLFWYGGVLNIFNMGPNLIRANFDDPSKNTAIFEQARQAVARLANAGGGVISSYYHPTEFVAAKFWDAVNAEGGAFPDPATWKRPPLRTPADAERSFRIFREFVDVLRGSEGVQFVNARDLLQRYGSALPSAPDKSTAAKHLAEHLTFLETEVGTFSAADLFLSLLGAPAQYVDGPTSRGHTTSTEATVPQWLFDRAVKDVLSFIAFHGRLPSEIFLGGATLDLPDFVATLAAHTLNPGPIQVVKGKPDFEKYVATDSRAAFRWAIHPKEFAAPELLELARLQAWTLKPARLR